MIGLRNMQLQSPDRQSEKMKGSCVQVVMSSEKQETEKK